MDTKEHTFFHCPNQKLCRHETYTTFGERLILPTLPKWIPNNWLSWETDGKLINNKERKELQEKGDWIRQQEGVCEYKYNSLPGICEQLSHTDDTQNSGEDMSDFLVWRWKY